MCNTAMKNPVNTKKITPFVSLNGRFLVAMPNIDDIRFERAVIYIYEHTPKGAAGLVINQEAQMSFSELLEQLQIDHLVLKNQPTVLLGGPDKFSNGFVLHSSEYKVESTRVVSPKLSLTSTQDILADIAWNKGPSDYLIVMGRACWAAGQLEDEIMNNIWLTADESDEILFRTPYADRWDSVLNSLGIQSAFLSSGCGRA